MYERFGNGIGNCPFIFEVLVLAQLYAESQNKRYQYQYEILNYDSPTKND